jgi:hypothetical protein
MFSFLKRSRKSSSPSRKASVRGSRPKIEALEDRQLLSASVFDLHSNGQLFLDSPDGTTQYLDSGVQAIASAGPSSVFDLHSDGKLYRQDIGGRRAHLDSGVQAIAGTGGASAFDLHTGGKLYRQDISGGRAHLGANGVVAADGSIWYLGRTAVDTAGDYAIYRLSNGQPTRMPGMGTGLTMAEGSLRLVNSSNQVYRWNGTAWTQQPTVTSTDGGARVRLVYNLEEPRRI